jgi:hypothetical protein
MTPYSYYGPREAGLTRAVGPRTGPRDAINGSLCRADRPLAMIARDDPRPRTVVRPPSRAAFTAYLNGWTRMPSLTIPLPAVLLAHDD